MAHATVIVTFLLVVAVLAVQDLPNLSRPAGQWVLRLRNSTHPRLVEQQFGIKVVRPLLIHQNIAGENERFFLFDDIEGRLHEGLFSNHPHIPWARFQPLLNRGKRDTLATSSAAPNDPLWAAQWYLHGTAGVDLNVTGVWDMGINGRGIVISIVDDGIDYKHAEFTGRYCAECSYDVNFSDDDPSPYSWDIHGTASASTAVSAANNYKCNVGVAPGAKIAGVRLLAADTTDFQEAEALGYALDKVDIYSNSWGPYDDGKTLEGPGELTLATLKNGVETGRDGKGAIYVWAGGNGNEQQDSCNYDGYANSRFTIAIGAIGKNGLQTYYSERCAALVAVTPSSDKQGNQVSTAMAYGECYTRFGGTSASSPMAAGAVALILQANPLLTWRDVQGVLIHSSVPLDLNNADWSTNGAGLRHNYRYGFGRVDAFAAVALAKTWDLLPAYVNTSSSLIGVSKSIPDKTSPPQYVTSTITLDDEDDDFTIEHVEVVFSAEHSRRGDLLIELTSPSQTVSTLAWTHTDSNANYAAWRFSSIRHWGERSGGSWTLRVSDGTTARTGVFKSWQLFVYGHK